MPKFIVKFDRPVTYLPDHPKAQREVMELIVNAPNFNAAQTHAIRVTTGNIGQMSVEVYTPPPSVPLPLEVDNTISIEVRG